MPGRAFLLSSLDTIRATLGAQGDPPHAPRRNIAPGQEILAMGADRVLRPMRWGIVPVGRVNARGRPVMETIVNARSETVFDKSAHAGTGRAVVPFDGWYEWTGPARRKTAWRLRAAEGGVLAFAAITDVWVAPGGREVAQVATLTTEPNADVRPIHHRMGVILPRDAISLWLDGSADEVRPLLRPWPDGALVIEPASGVDWTAP